VAGVLGPEPLRARGMRAEVALGVLAVLGIVAALYFAKAIFLPFVLAMLLTFLLAPAVRLLRGWGLPRAVAVAVVVAVAFVFIGGCGALVGQQVNQLAQKLPAYQFNIEEKIRSLRSATAGGTLDRISTFLGDLNQEIRRKDEGTSRSPATSPDDSQKAPMPVEIRQPEATPAQTIRQVLEPMVDPLATAGLVAIFVVFFLLQRQDLRDRLVRLAGTHDLQRTTEALDDGAQRLSRYFLAQTFLNVLFGMIVGAGLTFIGVPNPVLFGILAMVLRFVPYIGALIAAALPLALAIAVDPGWTMTLLTVGLFAVVEPLIGQVVEPLVYGRSTGLTPVAVILAATFWTWLWGPIGLLLSTPLTVCLGVLGRHIRWLQFLDIMIGEDAPLTPAQTFYQRALAGDPDEAVDHAEQMLKRGPLSVCYDEMVLQALILAQVDVRRGVLDAKQVEQINEVVRELVAELSDREDATPQRSAEEKTQHEAPPPPEPRDLPPERAGPSVLCIGGRGPFDDAAAAMLVQLLEKHGVRARLEPDRAVTSSNIVRLDSAGVAMVCLSYFELGNSPAHLRHSIRRIRRQMPKAKVLAGLWGHEGNQAAGERPHADTGADLYAFSLRQAVRLCAEASSSAAPEGSGATPVAKAEPSVA
jgi:predicted PurR-regulated permease PerM